MKDVNNKRSKVLALVKNIQHSLFTSLQKLDPNAQTIEDEWSRQEGGGGWSKVIQKGEIIDKGGVNVSEVYGTLPLNAIASMAGGRFNSDDFQSEDSRQFFATGVSVVIHPKNPHSPTAHCNFRYFDLHGGGTLIDNRQEPEHWWFGGGADLTPMSYHKEDAVAFHQGFKIICDKHHKAFYPAFKKWCDDYFLIKHRKERRGVGGLFFDNLSNQNVEYDLSFDELFEFQKECGFGFEQNYIPLLEKHKNDSFDEDDIEWQRLRRGRYVEFNLIYDRGTLFGLKTNGRIESILMSLPNLAGWAYDFKPKKENHFALIELLQNPTAWC